MKKYRVKLIKYETYRIEAENADAAIDKACEIADRDPDTWFFPVDEFEVEEIRDEDIK